MSGPEPIGLAWRRACQRVDRLDARLLLEHVCACTHVDLIARPERLMSSAQAEQFEALLGRREAGEPLAYLVGNSFFSGLEFSVTPEVLIPRPDTEVLLEQSLKRLQELAAPCVVDLGTGSGIVAILLARLCPTAMVTAVDVSATALEVARINAARHAVQIRFLQGDWYAPLGTERFDVIASNPPYVAGGDPHLEQNGLPFEPQIALTDGADGLVCIRALVAGAPSHLLSNGWLLIEHGYDQAVRVRELLRLAGFGDVDSWRDAAGIERVSGGRWP